METGTVLARQLTTVQEVWMPKVEIDLSLEALATTLAVPRFISTVKKDLKRFSS